MAYSNESGIREELVRKALFLIAITPSKDEYGGAPYAQSEYRAAPGQQDGHTVIN